MFSVDLSLTTVLLIIQSFIWIPSVVKLKYHKFRYSDFTSDINVTDMPLEPGLRVPGPLVHTSFGIIDEVSSGTVSSAQPQRNPTYRPSS